MHIEALQGYFNEGEAFKTGDIAMFYHRFEKNLKRTTINWRVHQLVQKGVLQRIGRGMFKLGTEKKYIPDISSNMKVVYQKAKKKFPLLDLSIWNTSTLNQFMIHQPNQFFTLIEAEQEATEAVFHYLKELQLTVFWEPGEEIMDRYLPGSNNAYIVQPLVSEAPVMQVEKVTCPTLEKILVDLFCDEIIFRAYQGRERSTISRKRSTAILSTRIN